MRELNHHEIDNVSGGILPLIGLAVAATGVAIAAHNYMLQRGAADHDANCTDH